MNTLHVKLTLALLGLGFTGQLLAQPAGRTRGRAQQNQTTTTNANQTQVRPQTQAVTTRPAGRTPTVNRGPSRSQTVTAQTNTRPLTTLRPQTSARPQTQASAASRGPTGRTLGRIYDPSGVNFINPIRDDVARQMNLRPGQVITRSDGSKVTFLGMSGRISGSGGSAYSLARFRDHTKPDFNTGKDVRQTYRLEGRDYTFDVDKDDVSRHQADMISRGYQFQSSVAIPPHQSGGLIKDPAN